MEVSDDRIQKGLIKLNEPHTIRKVYDEFINREEKCVEVGKKMIFLLLSNSNRTHCIFGKLRKQFVYKYLNNVCVSSRYIRKYRRLKSIPVYYITIDEEHNSIKQMVTASLKTDKKIFLTFAKSFNDIFIH